MLLELNDWAKGLGGGWAKTSFLVSLLLYVVGYLTIRFHLTAIGIGTDLSVLDERYLFAGARFLVYLVSCIPTLVLLLLPGVLLVAALRRICPQLLRSKLLVPVHHPKRLLMVGIVFVVVMIQFVMRQSFALVNLLLAQSLAGTPWWLVYLLRHEEWMSIYFSFLVAACGISLLIVWFLRLESFPRGFWAAAKVLFAGLVVVQILLLPINYGVLIVDKVMPRVAALGGTPLSLGERAWLVWEGRDGITFLVQGADQPRNNPRQQSTPARRTPAPRRLVTLARSDVKRLDILGFDHILPTLIGAQS